MFLKVSFTEEFNDVYMNSVIDAITKIICTVPQGKIDEFIEKSNKDTLCEKIRNVSAYLFIADCYIRDVEVCVDDVPNVFIDFKKNIKKVDFTMSESHDDDVLCYDLSAWENQKPSIN